MATVTLDILENASWEEVDGKIVRARRIGLVSGLADSVTAQSRIQDALDESGVPAAGEEHPNLSSLVLKRRIPRMIDPTVCQIDLLYEPRDFLDVDPPSGEDYVVSGGVSLEEETTAVDTSGNAITLSYKNRKDVAVQVPVLRPRRNLRFERQVFTTVPGSICAGLVGFTNSLTWQSGSAGTWLVVDATFQLRNPAAETGLPAPNDVLPLYLMSFEFSYNPNGWDPTAVYILPETGNPPDDWNTEAGASTTPAVYTKVDIDSLLPV